MEKKIIQSIDLALQVLELFSLEKPEWGVKEGVGNGRIS